MAAIIARAAGILFCPKKTFQQLREESFGDACLHFGIFLVLYSLLVSLVVVAGFLLHSWSFSEAMTNPFGFFLSPFLVVGTPLTFIIGLFLGGAILHLFIRLLGGKKGFEQTIRTVMYSTTPVFIFSWIPLICLPAVFYALFLEILAIREFQEISTERAILVVVMPFLLVLILIALAFSFFWFTSSTMVLD
jgi:hypothetical protein